MSNTKRLKKRLLQSAAHLFACWFDSAEEALPPRQNLVQEEMAGGFARGRHVAADLQRVLEALDVLEKFQPFR